jgi:hypothetical protein
MHPCLHLPKLSGVIVLAACLSLVCVILRCPTPTDGSSMRYQYQNMHPPLDSVQYTANFTCSRYNRLGPIFHTNLFMQPMILVGEPSLVKAVMGMDSMELRVPVFASERLLGDISLAKDSARNKIFVSSLIFAAVCTSFCSAGLRTLLRDAQEKTHTAIR